MNKLDLYRIEARFRLVDSSKTFNKILSIIGLNVMDVLDIGCGYGEYLKKFGKGSLGITTTSEEVEYGKLMKLNIVKGNAETIDKIDIDSKFRAVWANNLFEHLLSPHAFLIRLKKVSNENTLLILGVPVIPRLAWLINFKKFRGSLAIAHVNFFTRESLKFTVERAGWKVEQIRPFLVKNRIIDNLLGFIAPHLYVVAKNEINFSYHEKKLKEWKDDKYYSDLLDITETDRTRTNGIEN